MAEIDRTGENIARGHDAQRLLEHPLLKAAFAEIEASMFEELAGVSMHDEPSQKELLRSVKNLRRVKALLHSYIATGRYAKLIQEKSRVRRFIDSLNDTV